MPELRRAPQFRRDVADAWVYIAEGSLERADAFIDAVDRTIQLLVQTPHMGRPRPDLAVPGVRSFPTAGRYAIYYRPLEPDGIELLRLYHTSRDPEGLF